MKKLIAVFAAAAMLLTACSQGSAAKKEINLLTWEGYVPNEVVEAFTKETGITVNYSSANDNESMFSKLQAAKGGEYDVIICSDYIIKVMLEENLLKEFDKSKLPNFKNIDPAYQSQYYDPENKYAIPYTSSSAILVYDEDVLDFEVNSYEDLWNPALKDSVVLLDGDRDIIGLTLQSLGYSLNETDPAKLEEAKAKILELKQNVIAFDANTPHDKLISGEAAAGYMFGSQATAAMAEKPSIRFSFPEEGLGFYMDCLIMPVNAPNADNAYTFLNYVLDGKNSAAISNSIFYTNCNQAAVPFLSDEFKENPMLNIPEKYLAKSEAYMDLGDTSKIYSEIWTAFKNK